MLNEQDKEIIRELDFYKQLNVSEWADHQTLKQVKVIDRIIGNLLQQKVGNTEDPDSLISYFVPDDNNNWIKVEVYSANDKQNILRADYFEEKGKGYYKVNEQ